MLMRRGRRREARGEGRVRAEGERERGERDERRRTSRALEVEDAVLLEHVDLVDGADALDVELLELVAELGVVLGRGLLGDDLAADGRLVAACWWVR